MQKVLPQLTREPRAVLVRYGLPLYVGTLTAAAVAMVAAMVAHGVRLGSLNAVVALSIIALLAERESIRLSPTIEASVASLVFVFAAVSLGPLAAIVVGATGLLVDLRRPFLRWLLWTASRSLVAGCAGLAALAFHGPTTNSFGAVLSAVAAATAVEAVGDLVLGALTPMIRGTGSFKDVRTTVVPLLLASLPLHVPVIALLAFAYRAISPWSVVLFAIPAFAAQRLFLLYREQRRSAEGLRAANEHLEKANLSFATALVATLDARDRYTAGHSTSVAIYCRDIAERMNLDPSTQSLAHLCGLVHDVGKIGLPPGLLEKTGPLSPEERRQMEKHSEIGERILSKVADYSEIAAVVRHHHERVDGQGYPDGIKSDEIPLLARIVAVADAYDAMTSDRPYRDAMPSRVARLRLAQAVETQFDPTVVAAFEAILAAANEGYRAGGNHRVSRVKRSSDNYAAYVA